MVDGLTVPHHEAVTDYHINTNGVGGRSLDRIQTGSLNLPRRAGLRRSDTTHCSVDIGVVVEMRENADLASIRAVSSSYLAASAADTAFFSFRSNP